MSKTKTIIICAAIGFILSFIVGIFSSVSIGMIFLRAVFCSMLCAVLYVAVSMIFKKYLTGEISTGISDASNFSSDTKVGQIVDIKLDDNILPEDENGPSFKIPKELISDRNVMNSVSEPEDELMQNNDDELDTDDPFITVSKEKSLADSSSAKVYNEAAAKSEPFFNSESVSGGEGDSEIGSLPDMDSMLSNMQKSPTGEIITNSDFAKAGKAVEAAELKSADTEIMVRAIQTVLSRDQG